MWPHYEDILTRAVPFRLDRNITVRHNRYWSTHRGFTLLVAEFLENKWP